MHELEGIPKELDADSLDWMDHDESLVFSACERTLFKPQPEDEILPQYRFYKYHIAIGEISVLADKLINVGVQKGDETKIKEILFSSKFVNVYGICLVLIYPHVAANLFLSFTENGQSPIAIKKSSSLCSEVLPPIPRQKIPTASILG